MPLISSAIFGLKHSSLDKTIYLGHGSFASGTQEPPAAGASFPLVFASLVTALTQ